jgi:hypothetical protein
MQEQMDDLQVRLTGWTAFAGVMLIMAGALGAFEGLTAIFKDDWVLAGENYVITFDITLWGWIHLLMGALVMVAGFAVLNNALWGRTVGIVVAFFHALVMIPMISVQPWWTILIIVLDVVIIYGLIVPPRLEEPAAPRV